MSRPGDWNCRTCNHLNFQRRESCQRCGEPRSGGDYGGGFGGRGSSSFGFTTGPDVRPGDWYCTVGNCGAHNFASRSSCFKCGAPKEDSSAGPYDGDIPRMRAYGFGGTSARPGWKSGLDATSITSPIEWSATDAMHRGTLVVPGLRIHRRVPGSKWFAVQGENREAIPIS
ncbi:hypothetical protein CR513_56552 [Mucuna pruriens]|uniref:RanBP2-type domain-containing protein n=1 Tax=Mucuna pruriens TaxID=157652 RepID=A0A371EFT4_MUCPR|nr:hypothetical protein CR513_56552 [Mucuna pruriens]